VVAGRSLGSRDGRAAFTLDSKGAGIRGIDFVQLTSITYLLRYKQAHHDSPVSKARPSLPPVAGDHFSTRLPRPSAALHTKLGVIFKHFKMRFSYWLCAAVAPYRSGSTSTGASSTEEDRLKDCASEDGGG